MCNILIFSRTVLYCIANIVYLLTCKIVSFLPHTTRTCKQAHVVESEGPVGYDKH